MRYFAPRCLASLALLAAAAAALQTAPKPQVQDLPVGATPAQVSAPVAHAPAPAVSDASADAMVLPAKTPIQLQLETHLSTRDNSYGDGFAARVNQSVFYNGQELIPAGAVIEGHVMRVRDERPSVSDSELLLKPDQLTMPDGAKYTISAEVIQGDPHSNAKVNSEGVMQEPRGMMVSDEHHAEIGSGAGAVGGALLAGGTGAVTGAGVGAAVAVGIWLVRHRHLELNPGSLLTVRLDRPLALHPAQN